MASTINSSTSNGIVITPDTSGEIELQANGVTKAKVTANGLQDANGNSLRGGMYRNLIINGDMNIAQRGTSASGITSTGYRTVDRFVNEMSGLGTWTITQDTDVPTGQGFSNSMKLDCTSANASPAASEYQLFAQRIEGQMLQHLKKGTANAESLTLSFWVKSNKTGTYIAELFDGDNTRQISKSYTINSSDTWEKKTLTFAGDTTGTLNNDNGSSLTLSLWIGAGSTFTSGTLNTSWGANVNANRVVGQVNLADSTSNYINITGVQLEVGEGASDFEFLPYDAQLQRCQRYYEVIVPNDAVALLADTYSTGGSPVPNMNVFYKVTKRAYPTITTTGTFYTSNTAGSQVYSIGTQNFNAYYAPAGSGRSYWHNNANSGFLISAEL